MDFEKDLLWDELNLGGLVGAMHNPYGISEQDSMERVNKSKIIKKHNDIVQKPTYTAIMGRYDAQPHKPVSINSKKLDLLADPIKGRFSRFDESKYKLNLNAGSPVKRSMRLNDDHGSSVSPVKARYGANNGGFFLTGGDDNGEPDNEETDDGSLNRYGRSRNGLAAALRGRVSEAQKLNRQKDPMIQNKARGARRAVPAKNVGNRGAANNRAGAGRKEWRDTKYVDYLNKDKGMVGKRGGVVNGKGRGEPPQDRVRSKVAGSGYGYKNAEKPAPLKGALPKVKLAPLIHYTYELHNILLSAVHEQVTANGRNARLLRKLTGAGEEDTDGNYDSSAGRAPRRAPPAITRRAPVLRSKSTIDLPDRVNESDTDNEAGQRRRGQKTGVRSAPAQMNRSRSMPQKGPVDSHGNVITLDGLTKVNRKLSPLKPLPEVKTRRSRAKQEEAVLRGPAPKAAAPAFPSQARQMMQNMMAGMDMGGQGYAQAQPAGPGLSAEAAQMAQIALARAYRQQTDPLFAQEQAQQYQVQQQVQLQQMQQMQQLQQMQQAQQYTSSAVINNNIGLLVNPNPALFQYSATQHVQPGPLNPVSSPLPNPYIPSSPPRVAPIKAALPSSPARLVPQQQHFGAEESAYQIKPQDYSFLQGSLQAQTSAQPASPGKDADDEGGDEESENDDENENDSGNDSEPEEPARELDAEEQLVDDLVNMDIETALQRLQKFQTSAKKTGVDIDGSALSYAKPGAVATFTKHAKNLSSSINAAESYLASYRNLAEGGYGGGASYGIKGELA